MEAVAWKGTSVARQLLSRTWVGFFFSMCFSPDFLLLSSVCWERSERVNLTHKKTELWNIFKEFQKITCPTLNAPSCQEYAGIGLKEKVGKKIASKWEFDCVEGKKKKSYKKIGRLLYMKLWGGSRRQARPVKQTNQNLIAEDCIVKEGFFT